MVIGFASPSTYIQGKNVILDSDKYLQTFGKHPLLLAGSTAYHIIGHDFEEYLQAHDYTVTYAPFNGESSDSMANHPTKKSIALPRLVKTIRLVLFMDLVVVKPLILPRLSLIN